MSTQTLRMIGPSSVGLIALADIDQDTKPWHACPYFPDQQITALSRSIKKAGGKLDQPIGIRPTTNGQHDYELIYGVRRFHACLRADVNAVEAKVYQVDDVQARILALRENQGRNDPPRLLTGWGYLELESEGYSRQEIAVLLGVSPSQVTECCKEGEAVSEEELAESIARVAPDMDHQQAMVATIYRLSKRSLEKIKSGLQSGDVTLLDAAVAATTEGNNKREVSRHLKNLERNEEESTRPEVKYEAEVADGYCSRLLLRVKPEDLDRSAAIEVLSHLESTKHAIVQHLDTVPTVAAAPDSPNSPSSPGESILGRLRRFWSSFKLHARLWLLAWRRT